MSNLFRSMFGLTYVEAKADSIIIGSISTAKFLIDINNIWNNSKVISIVFKKINKYSVEFDSFFAIDILYMLEQVYLFKRRKSSKYRIGTAIDQLKEKTWLKRMNVKYPSIINRKGLDKLFHKPLPHQESFFEIYSQKTQQMNLKGFLLAAGMGFGKSYVSLALSECLDVDVTILLAPKSISDDVWKNSLLEELGPDVSYWNSTESKPLGPGYRYYIFHYEALNKMLLLGNYIKTKKSMIVLDESHNFNNEGSLRSSRLIEFCKRVDCKHVIFSSGTAVKLTGNETVTLLKCIDPLFTDEVEIRFKKIFGVSAKRAVDILRHRLDFMSHKSLSSEYMKNIPPPIIKQLRIKIPDWQLYTVENVKKEMRAYMIDQAKYYTANMDKYVKIYDDCLKVYQGAIKTRRDREDFDKYVSYIKIIRKGYDPVAHKEMLKYCNEFEKKKIAPSLKSPAQRRDFKESKSVFKYLKLKILGMALGNVLAKRQSECHTKMIAHSKLIDIVTGADKKTLCFTSYTEVAEEADRYFKSHGLKPTLVYGKNKRSTGDIVAEFRADQSINPIIATLQSMSVGVTLVNCSVCIFLNSAQRSIIQDQASARIYRIGQDCRVYIYECILESGSHYNISEKTQDMMEFSRKCVEDILGKSVNEKGMDGIVKRLNMNPETRFEKVIHMFRDLFD